MDLFQVTTPTLPLILKLHLLKMTEAHSANTRKEKASHLPASGHKEHEGGGGLGSTCKGLNYSCTTQKTMQQKYEKHSGKVTATSCFLCHPVQRNKCYGLNACVVHLPPTNSYAAANSLMC